MNKNQRLRYEMFLRVRDFGHVHRDRFPESSTAGKAFAAAVAGLEAHAMAGLLTAEEGRTARDAARDALVDRLTAIARTARVIARALPGADAVFRMPAERSDTSLLTTARAFISEGQAVKNRFVPLGTPDDFLTGLQKVVDTYDQAIGGRRGGARRHEDGHRAGPRRRPHPRRRRRQHAAGRPGRARGVEARSAADVEGKRRVHRCEGAGHEARRANANAGGAGSGIARGGHDGRASRRRSAGGRSAEGDCSLPLFDDGGVNGTKNWRSARGPRAHLGRSSPHVANTQ